MISGYRHTLCITTGKGPKDVRGRHVLCWSDNLLRFKVRECRIKTIKMAPWLPTGRPIDAASDDRCLGVSGSRVERWKRHQRDPRGGAR